MRILALAHRMPFPPNKGDKIRGIVDEGRHVNIVPFRKASDDVERADLVAAIRREWRSMCEEQDITH